MDNSAMLEELEGRQGFLSDPNGFWVGVVADKVLDKSSRYQMTLYASDGEAVTRDDLVAGKTVAGLSLTFNVRPSEQGDDYMAMLAQIEEACGLEDMIGERASDDGTKYEAVGRCSVAGADAYWTVSIEPEEKVNVCSVKVQPLSDGVTYETLANWDA